MKPLELWIEKTYQGHGDAFGIARTTPFPNHIHVIEAAPRNEELCEGWFESYDNLRIKLQIATEALKTIKDQAGHSDRCDKPYLYCEAGCEFSVLAEETLEKLK